MDDHELTPEMTPEEMDHAYMHAHGVPHDHEYDHSYDHPQVKKELEEDHAHLTSHGHTHSHTQTRAVVNRLARAIGHLERVKAMVEEGRDCSEVLIQLAAVRSAINNTGKVVLKDHLEHCIVEAMENHDKATIDELNRAIEQFVK